MVRQGKAWNPLTEVIAMRLRTEELAGFEIGELTICAKCAENSRYFGEATADAVVTVEDLQESGELVWCDECGQRLL